MSLETGILKPRHPSIEDTDQWPEFMLNNVHVHLPDDPEATANLLEAAEGYPLTVVGQLEPLDEEDAHLYAHEPTTKRVNIILENVYTFSYGQYGDGSTAIWAAGKAGWYTIKPGRRYKATYSDMVDAVNVLYFVADAYREERKAGKGKSAKILPDYSAQELFAKYAAEELGSEDAAEGADKIYEYKDFLISSMIAGKEGLSWSKFPLYKHLFVKFPDVWAEMKQRQTPRPPKPESQKSRAKTTRRESIETTDSAKKQTFTAKTRTTRQGSVDTISTASSTRQRRGNQQKKVSRPVEVISLDGSSDAGSAARNTHTRPKTAGKGTKSTSRRTRATSEAISEEEHDSQEMDLVETPTKDDDSDVETKLRARKNKSSLRPRPSKAPKSTTRDGGKRPAPGEHDDDEELPPSPTGKRRLADVDDARPTSKRRNSRQHLDEGIDIPTSPSNSGEADDASTPDTTSNLVNVPIRSLNHLDPVQEDTWVCALDGCAHKVYAASSPEAQLLIKQHYNLHAFDDDERIQMIKKMQAPSLPASRLMERVKLQAKAEGFPGSHQMAPRFPAIGVTQRY
ncbi:hypothetical protein CLAFUW4_05914 [Fulvia fulva]|uniref:DNA (cytosine-5)-methyltransferase 1 replication foci domain-containing protein n=1 Tax=Passalora fulva TaxID=5499 RepID=A0A9Q8P8T4_PASFU|nr:uncharacterized protein CLAFUR5_06058 [Fulvia fulva]KAK4624476.1 hypothetical protein CLAFUR4_05919 [Fulvia fulva]KAK4625154.1 hypothetical protein CLAFUR0_05921 [Fulvia fulva]UJO17549.1 hypothetical protein CLAFUR5_06058 [Fulvia fulva]WPV14436.1 hypothetical protein CLAFUW4_05914 [Fulvia fulva]WPV29634.1 hypothetical protein CLAFUW7_05912 [Fulvia fulva]